MANILRLLDGVHNARSISAVVGALLGASNEAAAREVIGIQPHAIGQMAEFSVPVILSGGMWTDDRGWQWLPMIGQSIGNTGSGADTIDVDLETLFLALWPHLALNTPGYAIQDSSGSSVTAGASAQDDWANNTRLVLPDHRGRGSIAPGQGPGLSDRQAGQSGGEEEHALTDVENGPHGHTASSGGGGAHNHSTDTPRSFPSGDQVAGLGLTNSPVFVNRVMVDANGANVQTDTEPNHTHTVAVNSSGSGLPHNVMGPFIVVEKMVFTGIRV